MRNCFFALKLLDVLGAAADVTRRELGHIFRSREGFRVRVWCRCLLGATQTEKTGDFNQPAISLLQSLRLVIKDSKKHVGEKLVMAFVEYSSTYFAAQAMDTLQVGVGRAGGASWFRTQTCAVCGNWARG